MNQATAQSTTGSMPEEKEEKLGAEVESGSFTTLEGRRIE